MFSKALDFNIQPGIIYNEIVNIYVNTNDYSMAFEFYTLALSLTNDDDETHLLATTLANIASVYHRQGSYKQALKIYERASDLFVDAYGGFCQHPKQASLYDMMGLAYRQYGTFDKALKYYQDSLTILKETLPSNHPNLAQCYNNVDLVIDDQGDSDSAFEYFQIALGIIKQSECHSPILAGIYGNLAVIYSNRHQYDLALQYHERSINLYREIYAENHPDLAARYTNLGVTLTKQRKFDEAANIFDKARTIFENQDINTFPLDYPRCATCYSNMSDLYCEKDDFNRAFELLTEALHIRQAYFSPDHPLIATHVHNLGTIRYKQGYYYRAFGFFK